MDFPTQDQANVAFQDVGPKTAVDQGRRPTPLFLVLEGAGAKGIAHIAAWEVLEQLVSNPHSAGKGHADPAAPADPKILEVTEVAGTSAGAVVAAFIAAGARAGQLIDSEGRMPLATALGIEYFHDLFGMTGWRRLKLWRRLLTPRRSLVEAASRIAGHQRKRGAAERRARRRPRWFPRRYIYEPLIDAMAWMRIALRPLAWLAIIVATFVFGGWLLDRILLSRPASAGINFVTFWLLAYLGFTLRRALERGIDQRGILHRARRPTALWRTLLHPATVVVLAGVGTYLMHQWTPAISFLARWLNLLPEVLGDGLLYGLCTSLAIFTLFSYGRGFLKGAVRTRQLRRDLNVALRKILTQQERFDQAADSYQWHDKVARDDDEARFLDRLQPEGYEVTFGDLEIATGRRLSIVAADVIANEVRVYSTSTHRNFPVAYAVSASLAIPFAFRAMRTWSRLLVDGAVVSSIPAWVFRRHRTRDPDARILAIGIASAEPDIWIPHFLGARRVREKVARKGRRWTARLLSSWTDPVISLWWPLRFMANTAYTAAYGGRSLELDASDRLDSFPLVATFDLLDFDKARNEVKAERYRLKTQAEHYINDLLWERQEAFERACAKVEEDLWDGARANGADVDTLKREGARLRFYWAIQEERAESARIRRVYNFKREELDDRLVLPYGSTIAGMSAARGASCFAQHDVLERMLTEDMNRYRRKVRWRDRKWCWAIPIESRSKPRMRGHSVALRETKGVLVIESNRPLTAFGVQLGIEGAERSAGWLDSASGRLRRDDRNGNLAPHFDARAVVMSELEQTWRTIVQEEYLELPARAPSTSRGTDAPP